MKRRLLAALSLGTILALSASPADAYQLQSDWLPYTNGGVTASWFNNNGVLSKFAAACDDNGYLIINGSKYPYHYYNKSAGQFMQSGHLQSWCNESFSDLYSSYTCYPRMDSYSNNTVSGFFGYGSDPNCGLT